MLSNYLSICKNAGLFDGLRSPEFAINQNVSLKIEENVVISTGAKYPKISFPSLLLLLNNDNSDVGIGDFIPCGLLL